jgi:hypothetical protein
VGTISATGNGRTIFIINGVGGKLYWAYSLTDESTDGRSKVRSKDAAEMKARLKQEFKGWDLALKILEVLPFALFFLAIPKASKFPLYSSFHIDSPTLQAIFWQLTF